MPGPRIAQGVRAPLFDRLAADPREGGGSGGRMLDRDGLRASIRRELDRLLNTRTPLAADELGRRPRGTLDYGLPDLSLFWPFDADSEARLARLVAATVAAFEPRLVNPRVTVARAGNERGRLRATVTGSVLLDGMVEPVSFPILLTDSVEDGLGDMPGDGLGDGGGGVDGR
ncbi:type VI secretion system protein ImpF [Azospirillum agricola]|uniref:type VI secretion system baseplate subunit TssE n=1 Tax=Azospirillum agricola TaxID=1720247 RepID=UPI001AE59B3B|nr:type VI secretion system baseplate subunit TssE [Azospirillum agricola]MBP2233051.1 type VI secretion system protein ImpF [Azospirillum agricola]